MPRLNKVNDFTQLISLLLREDEYNTLEHNKNNISPLEEDQLLSLYNGLHNKNYQDLKKYTPQSEFTDKIYMRICLAAVQEKGRALQFVSEKHKSEEICLAAVKEDGWALEFVPEEKCTYELCLAAVKNNVSALQFVPENEYIEKIYLAAVQEDGWALELVPEEKRTYELCLAAVKNNVSALQFVPENEYIEKIYLAAVQKNGWALEFIPEEKLTDELCLAAVKNDVSALQLVPEKKRSYKLCLAAVKKDGRALQFVPEEKCTYELCLAAAEKDVSALQFVPPNDQSEKIYLAAIIRYGLALEFVPEEKRSYKLCLAAVKKDSRALQFVPEKHKSEEMYLSAVKENSLLLECVPKEMRLSIINTITPELILSNNYFSKDYFPYIDNKEDIFNNFLEKIEHVIVTKKNIGEEEKISFLVYGNKRLGKTTHIINDSVDELFSDIKRIDSKRDINLVLISHEDRTSDTISDLHIKDIISLLEKYDNINRVTLLACHSAQSNQLKYENELIEKILNSDKERSRKKHRLVLATESFFNSEKTPLGKLLEGADVAYVIKSRVDGEYDLASVEKRSDGSIEKKDIKTSLDKEDVIALQNLAEGTRKKGFDKFLGKNEKCSLRTKEDHLNLDELDVISSIIESPKKIYLSTSSATIYDKKEIEKLKPSLLKKLVTAIEENRNIDRKILVKGYTKFVHADKKKMGFHVGKNLYTDTKTDRFFIHPNTLSKHRRDTMRTIRSFNEPENTKLKAIKVITTPTKRKF